MHDSSDPVDCALAATSIIIPVKDDTRVVECINSIDEDAVEIVLALNGATDEIKRIAATHPRDAVVTGIEEAGNLGAAYNAGVEAAGGRYLLFMDSDCLFAPGTIRTMVAAVLDHPVVKGQVVYTHVDQLLSRLTTRVRDFDEGEFVSAYSPPLIYDRTIIDAIGGYHYNELIHWLEDREFDFRLQLAGIPVHRIRQAAIYHGPQTGFSDLRSYFRYGIGEAIGQELGNFVTPAIPFFWRLWDDGKALLGCVREKGLLVAALYLACQLAYHAGTLYHLLRDPYKVRPLYPPWAGRVRMFHAVSEHGTRLSPAQIETMRRAYRQRGFAISGSAYASSHSIGGPRHTERPPSTKSDAPLT